MAHETEGPKPAEWNDDRGDGRTPNGQFARGVTGNARGRAGRLGGTLSGHMDGAARAADASEPENRASSRGYFADGGGWATAHNDGWSSTLTGIGNAMMDKRMSSAFYAMRLSYFELIEMWLGDDLFTRAVETLPGEAFREGYELSIADDEDPEGELKHIVESKLRDLQVDQVLERAWQVERALGGAAVLLGVDDGQPLSAPLNPDRAKSFEWLQVLEPIQLVPSTFYDDPNGPKYGEPKLYMLTAMSPVTPSSGVPMGDTVGGGLQQRTLQIDTRLIHESRLIILGGIRVSRFQRHSIAAGGWWGESVIVRMYDIIRDFHNACAAAGLIVTDFSQAVMKMDGLVQIAARQGADNGELANRMRALNMGRSVARAILIDTKEEFKRESVQISGLTDLLNWLASRVASVLDMPLTLLMGQSPKGLGNEGESDVRFYNDRVASLQARKVSPWLRRIITLVFKVLKKPEPKRWDIEWRALWQMDDAETAEARLTMARADSLYAKMGALHLDEIRKSRWGGSKYSYETHVDLSKPAPGPIAPMGAAHVPDGMRAQPGSLKPQGVGAGSHGVSGYSRRNPQKTSQGAEAKVGGDAAPGAGVGAKADAMDFDVQAAWFARVDAVAAAIASMTTEDADELDASVAILRQAMDRAPRPDGEPHMDYIEKRDGRFHVMSEEGKSLGDYATREEAVRRLRQVEWFKHHPST